MSLAKPLPRTRDVAAAELELGDRDFEAIARMVHADFGLHLQASKKALVFSRLARRVRELGLPDFASYVAHVRSNEGGPEKSNMLSALTTNVTQFFREAHHFEQLRKEVLPELVRQAREGARVRLWSAACSAGQEPYSLAATLLSICPDAARLDIKILATDIDPVVIARARDGRYPMEELDAIPKALRDLATRSLQGAPEEFEVSQEVKQLITFNIVNLIGDWPMRGNFDVILCRNVAIYFDKATQARLWQRFNRILKPGGYLMIGHSERLSDDQSGDFSSVGITAYRKNSNASAAMSDRSPKKDRT